MYGYASIMAEPQRLGTSKGDRPASRGTQDRNEFPCTGLGDSECTTPTVLDVKCPQRWWTCDLWMSVRRWFRGWLA